MAEPPGPAGQGAIIRPLLTELAQGDLNGLLGYDKEAGRPAQRQLFVDWLAEQGITASEDRLLFSHGAQHGIMLALLATGCVGETLFCEGLSYPGMLGNARQLKNQVVGLAMDEEGLLPEALDAACRTRRAKLLYLTPTLQNPTTATMSLARRDAIVAIARRHDLLIVEDDVNGLLPESALPPWSTWHRSGSSTLAVSPRSPAAACGSASCCPLPPFATASPRRCGCRAGW